MSDRRDENRRSQEEIVRRNVMPRTRLLEATWIHFIVDDHPGDFFDCWCYDETVIPDNLSASDPV